jgi:hypothetical protein
MIAHREPSSAVVGLGLTEVLRGLKRTCPPVRTSAGGVRNA